jgi:hypothetical protein
MTDHDPRDPNESNEPYAQVVDHNYIERGLESRLEQAYLAWIDKVAARRKIPRREAAIIVLGCLRTLANSG